MKLLIAVINKTDAPVVASAMSMAGYHSTVSDSYGGFLKKENSIILSAIDDTKVSSALKIIRDHTSERIEDVPSDVLMGNFKLPTQIKTGRAVVFTLNVDQFAKL
ncbi:MAG: cyclic-di-AMP receptor [Oscillospiraceae bacterium]|nr:cyclic-di-AMP receptor [Oscillospiraceae bacterium]